MCLQPHNNHESQPLDADVFKPLKKNWHSTCHKFVQKNPGKVLINKSSPLHEAWNNTMIPTVISSGFKRSGIYPMHLIMGQAKAQITKTKDKVCSTWNAS